MLHEPVFEDGETVDMQELAEKRAEMTELAEQTIDLNTANNDSDVFNKGDSRNKEGLQSRRRIAKVNGNNYATSIFFQV